MQIQRDVKWDFELCREFDAPVELVFRAWTDIDMLNEWLVTDDWQITCTGEFAVGSKVKQEMQSATQGFVGYMEPVEMIENKKVIMKSWWEPSDGADPEITTVTLSFKDLGDSKTLFTYHQTFESEDSLGRGEEEFAATFDMFAVYVESRVTE